MSDSALNVMMVAGETSGDMHAASLATQLLSLRPDIELWGMGGVAMSQAGVSIEQPMDAVEVMGFVEVLSALGDIRSAFNRLVKLAAERHPVAAILTDFPDFNLRLATRLKEMGIPIIYFISPKVWAWRKRRAKTIAQLVDLMLLILPFEPDFYRQLGVKNPVYVGNPLVDQLQPMLDRSDADIRTELGLKPDEPVIGVLPGSRFNEIKQHAQAFSQGALKAAEQVGGATVLVAPPAGDKADKFGELVKGLPVRVVPGKSREVLKVSKVALVKSGTGTLEAAVLGTPAVVAFRCNFFTYLLLKMMVSIPRVALPNIIAGKEIYPELIQDISPDRIAAALVRIWQGDERGKMIAGIKEVRDKLGPPGAARRAAEAVAAFLDSRAKT